MARSRPTRIVWMSRHSPTTRQRQALATHFSNPLIFEDNRTFDNADSIIARFRAISGDELVVVAPLALIRQLCRRGLHPIYASMRQVPCSSADAETSVGEGHRG